MTAAQRSYADSSTHPAAVQEPTPWTIPEWLEACERLGYGPSEWRTSRLASPSTAHQAAKDEVMIYVRDRFMLVTRSRAEAIAHYEAEAERLEALLRYDPARFRATLGVEPSEPTCKDWCCRG